VASTIGIKIANGEFYSIVEENSQEKKRLVLTTVHDNQRSVQIDFYRSSTKTMADASYIGSMVMEKIKPKPKGEPSIELVIASTNNGDITANAANLDASGGGERQTLNVSLKSMEEDNREYDIPDFELDYDKGPPAGLYENITEIEDETERKRFPWLVVILTALVLTAIALVLWIFLFQGRDPKPAQTTVSSGQQTQAPAASAPQAAQQQPVQMPAPETPPAEQQPVVQQPAQTPVVSTPPPVQQQLAKQEPAQAQPSVIQAPAQTPVRNNSPNRERPVAPVASFAVPSVIPADGVQYRVRYGDTLWDIAEAFYRNPWLYTHIARFNNIRNPDLIISGTTISVPPRN
jgi:LysM repeat protein